MATLDKLPVDPVISELLNIVQAVRSGEVVSLSVVVTERDGNVYSQKLGTINQQAYRSAG